eukprot:TRINITY_DN6085_c0_g1_i1.p1 TRINITY_DN6085_c0_g1~~TRINITY_DN6085_c0_g1_i1.p1  ORF type:complete len:551 (-),score=201.31 TRINITY_DN6085_c0_g1_i1:455-2107(-)
MSQIKLTSEGNAVGVCIGYTNASVSLYKEGGPQIVVNDDGLARTPCVVAYTEEEQLVGLPAKKYSIRNSGYCVTGITQILGNENDQEAMNRFKKANRGLVYSINDNDTIEFSFQYTKYDWENEDAEPEETELTVTGEQVASVIFAEMKRIAESSAEDTVDQIVLAVPPLFTVNQRKALVNAAHIAGLKVLRVINEPIAGAIGVGLDTYYDPYLHQEELLEQREEDNDESSSSSSNTPVIRDPCRRIIMVKMGGGSSYATLLNIRRGIMEMQHTESALIGCDNLDDNLLKHFAKDFQRKTRMDVYENRRSVAKLHAKCVEAKLALGQSNQANIHCDSLQEGVDFNCSVSLSRWEDMNSAVFQGMKNLVKALLQSVELNPEDIDVVLITGGGAKVSKVVTSIKSIFSNTETTVAVPPNCDQLATRGAATQASLLEGQLEEDDVDQIKVSLRVAPNAISVENADGNAVEVIPRFIALPYRTVRFISIQDQTKILMKVLEGTEKELCTLNMDVVSGCTIKAIFEMNTNDGLIISLVNMKDHKDRVVATVPIENQ